MEQLRIDSEKSLLEEDKRLLKQYFEKVVSMAREKPDNAFVVDIDDVWALAYSTKGHCLRALERNFLKDVDYKVETITNKEAGRPEQHIMMTLQCMEFLVARKVRPVFEVYRKVFHAALKKSQGFSDEMKRLKELRCLLPGSASLNTPFEDRVYEKGWVYVEDYDWQEYFYIFLVKSTFSRKDSGKTDEEIAKDFNLALIHVANFALNKMLKESPIRESLASDVEYTLRDMNRWRAWLETHNAQTGDLLDQTYSFDNTPANVMKALTTNLNFRNEYPKKKVSASL